MTIRANGRGFESMHDIRGDRRYAVGIRRSENRPAIGTADPRAEHVTPLVRVAVRHDGVHPPGRGDGSGERQGPRRQQPGQNDAEPGPSARVQVQEPRVPRWPVHGRCVAEGDVHTTLVRLTLRQRIIVGNGVMRVHIADRQRRRVGPVSAAQWDLGSPPDPPLHIVYKHTLRQQHDVGLMKNTKRSVR